MGDHEQGSTVLFCDLAKQSENLLAGIRIKRTGRLIGKQDLGISGYGSGDRYALPLSDRKLIGSEIKSPAQSDPTKDLSGSLQGIRSFSAAKAQPDGDVLDRSKRSQKMEVLKHHPAMFPPMLVELGGTQGRKIDPGYRDLASIRATQP